MNVKGTNDHNGSLMNNCDARIGRTFATDRAETTTELILERAGPVIFKTF